MRPSYSASCRHGGPWPTGTFRRPWMWRADFYAISRITCAGRSADGKPFFWGYMGNPGGRSRLLGSWGTIRGTGIQWTYRNGGAHFQINLESCLTSTNETVTSGGGAPIARFGKGEIRQPFRLSCGDAASPGRNPTGSGLWPSVGGWGEYLC